VGNSKIIKVIAWNILRTAIEDRLMPALSMYVTLVAPTIRRPPSNKLFNIKILWINFTLSPAGFFSANFYRNGF
jgi:hypothetical protein